jgi:hypothetical protein
MRRLFALALLLCAGCEATDFFEMDTHRWFATNNGGHMSLDGDHDEQPRQPAAPAQPADPDR